MYFHIGKCRVCDSPQRAEIEKALLHPNRIYKHITKKYGPGYKVLKKHFDEHMSEEARKVVFSRVTTKPKNYKPIEMDKLIPSVTDVVGTLEFIQKELWEIYVDAKQTGKTGIRLAALRQASNNTELAIRAREIIIDATSQQGWQALIPKILRAVDDYPDAKRAISVAMRQIRDNDPDRITWVKE